MSKKKTTRAPRYRNYVVTAIDAAKLSIEMFNRVEGSHIQHATLIFNAQAWELLAKGIWIKKKENIYSRKQRTHTAEKVVNTLYHKWRIITKEEDQTILEVISLRNEALHDSLPRIDEEILMHLLYYSTKTFHRVLNETFRAYAKDFDRNFLSISFTENTHFAHRVQGLLKHSKSFRTQENKLLYLLDRACKFAENDTVNEMKSAEDWKNDIKKLPKGSRVARHLPIYDYMNKQEMVRFVPVEVKRGHQPIISTQKTKDPQAPVLVQKTDPEIDFPHFTSDLVRILGKSQSFIAKAGSVLGIKGNREYCYLQPQSKGGNKTPRYSDKALNYLKDYFDKHPDFNPYKK
ncbi:MAG: hypothetical protein HGB37_04230 [Candidatus Moranbacteria bacterium]|nr:hypothetical protein [Candidatus Moranbacteria bacterium]